MDKYMLEAIEKHCFREYRELGYHITCNSITRHGKARIVMYTCMMIDNKEDVFFRVACMYPAQGGDWYCKSDFIA